jgi:PAS domain S-box-containing protein
MSRQKRNRPPEGADEGRGEFRETEAELRYVLTHARCLLWSGTVARTPNGSLDWFTQVHDEEAAQKFCPLELLPGERYTQAWYRHRLPEGQRLTDAGFQKVFAQDLRDYRAEFGCRNKHGVVQWFDEMVHIEPIAPDRWRVVGVCTDITDRRRAEEARRHSEAQFRALVEGVKEYALFLMDTTGRIISWNPGVERIFGYTEREFVGSNVHVIFTPEDRAAGIPETEMAIARSRGSAPDDRWHLRKDGTRFYASGVVHPVRDDEGNLQGYTKVLSDATRKKRAEEELQAAYEKEQRIAATLQRSLLVVLPPDTFPGISIKPLYEAAWDDALIGGDFFDVFAVEENRIALVVGDATGKGLEAATHTAEVKYALRAFLRENSNPAIALERLNNFVADAERLDIHRMGISYTAIALAIVNTITGEVMASCAGMEPPFLLRAATREVVELRTGGPLMGIIPRARYEIEQAVLESGDLLVMTTDGITEARRGREFFGYDGLVEAVREAEQEGGTLAEIGLTVTERVRTFSRGKLNDDICLLLARRK